MSLPVLRAGASIYTKCIHRLLNAVVIVIIM